MQKISKISTAVLLAIGMASGLTACSSGSNSVDGISVQENRLNSVQIALATGTEALNKAETKLQEAQNYLSLAENATDLSDQKDYYEQALASYKEAQMLLTAANKSLNSDIYNTNLSSAAALSNTIVSDVQTARNKLSGYQTTFAGLTTDLDDVYKGIALQEIGANIDDYFTKVNTALNTAGDSLDSGETNATEAKNASTNTEAVAEMNALYDDIVAAQAALATAQENYAVVSDYLASGTTATPDVQAAAEQAKKDLETAQARLDALNTALDTEQETRQVWVDPVLFKDYTTTLSATGSVAQLYKTEEMRDKLLAQIKTMGTNGTSIGTVNATTGLGNCSGNSSACGTGTSYTGTTYLYDTNTQQFVANTGTTTGSIIVHVSNAYSGYAVLREESELNGVTVNSFVSLVDSANKTTDKAQVVNARYTGKASYYDGSSARIRTDQLVLNVNDGVVSGSVYRPQNQNATRHVINLVKFEDTTVDVIHGNVGFSGTAYMLTPDHSTSLSASSASETNVTLDTQQGTLVPRTSSGVPYDIVQGTYQGQFAGSQAEEVVGTWEGYKTDGSLYMQGAFSGTK
ncbi:hypothetical protein [Lonepinella sp. BR2271]|uniref:hypothetical protein n=1 Tax=Lonepinella sp. BR2271 TaxID=3434550 RepID=UPI003F6E2547